MSSGHDRAALVRDGRHQAPDVLIGKWINEGGVDGGAYGSTFYDSFGNVHRSRLEIQGSVLRWIADRTRCTVTMTGDGMTQVAHHESTTDGVNWAASMDVTLRKVA